MGLGLCIGAHVQAAIPATERAVLDEIYRSTNGGNWTMRTGWGGEAGSECSWHGVICVGDHVTEIYLEDNNLSGPLPAINGLTHLQTFMVSINGLTGSVPPLDGMNDLLHFSVFANQLTGPLPNLAGVPNLLMFDAGINHFSGRIPTFEGVVRLAYFDVDSNHLVGSVPPLAGLSNLRHFHIGGNRLTGRMPDPPQPSLMTAGRARLCAFSAGRPDDRNRFEPIPNPVWDAATGTTPWYGSCDTAPIFIDDFDN